MQKRRFIWILLVLPMSQSWLRASWEPYNKNHGPFDPNKWPIVFNLARCDRFDEMKASIDEFRPQSCYGLKDRPGAPRIYLGSKPSQAAVWLVVEDQHGSRIGGPKIIGSHAAGGEQVYWADLNADKREDFVIKTLVGGCGTIYTFSCNVTFVLSEGERYSITPTGGLWSGLRYLVDMNGDGICEFVHTTFVQGSHVKGRDGRGHNYWVYNILGIRRGGLVIKNSLAPQFAKWIWYTYKPNHQATTQITKTQKELLWKKYADQIFWKPSAKRSTKSR